jgi:isopenicillin N synthase-like dioxygenase
MTAFADIPRVPIIDLSLFDAGDPWRNHVAAQIDWAAAEFGCFYIIGHGVDAALIETLVSLGHRLFAQQARALQGRKVYPELPGFREAVPEYTRALTGLGHKLMTSIGRGLRLGDNYFVDRYTGNPSTLFQILNFPPAPPVADEADEGLLTILNQDEAGALQVKHGSRWIDVPYVAGSFVCAVGETLAEVTRDRYTPAPRQIFNRSPADALVMPFVFDAQVDAALLSAATSNRAAADYSDTSTSDGTARTLHRGRRRLPTALQDCAHR